MMSKCKKCGAKMKRGVAIKNTLVGGAPDFCGSEIITMSYGGAGKLISVNKCTKCGWSVST